MHLCVFILYVWLSSVWVYLRACVCFYTNMYFACVCAFAIQCAVEKCVCLPLPFPLILTCKPLCVKVWDVSSGVWLLGDLSCGNIQVWDPSLSVGLTWDGRDLPRRLLTKPRLCMIQKLSKRVPCRGQTFHKYISDAVHFSLHRSNYTVNIMRSSSALCLHMISSVSFTTKLNKQIGHLYHNSSVIQFLSFLTCQKSENFLTVLLWMENLWLGWTSGHSGYDAGF